MSLRLRLLFGLMALAAVGLVVVGVVTHRELDSFLVKRVDQQVRSAVEPMSRVLFVRSRGVRAALPPGTGAGRVAPPGRETRSVPAPPGGALAPGGEPPPGLPPPAGVIGFEGGPGGPLELPPGTYGELRNARGNEIRHVLVSFGESGLKRPALPREVPISSPPGQPRLFTVGARGDSSSEFRAVAVAAPFGSRSVVIAVPLHDVQSTLDRLTLIEVIVTAVVLLALAGLAWWVIGIGLSPLERMASTAGEIAEGDLSRRVEPGDPRTEVGRLGLALNAMLGKIEEAFDQRRRSEERMRRFLADASHELRTPLSSIRGYAEVFRIGAASKPEEVDRAMRRIEEESARMGVLVDDLLTLARLDEVREPARERVDLATLVAEACEDARAAAPEREISLEAPETAVVVGDPDQLQQVINNLLRNAVAHTPGGTAIRVALSAEGDHAILHVRDDGPGVGDDASQVFERFWRQSESRGRDGGGAGLGLAIVAAVVQGHGGQVSAANAPGGGALFTVSLPLAPPPDDES